MTLLLGELMGVSFIRLIKLYLFTFPINALPVQAANTPPILEGSLSIIVHIEGLKCCEGIVRLGVYHDKAFWMREDGMVRGRIGMVTATSQTVEIHGLPAGEYAIAVHQDVNGDGKFNRILGLIPKEPYGFSNNVGKYGPASFEKAAIQLDENMEITVHMHRGSSK